VKNENYYTGRIWWSQTCLTYTHARSCCTPCCSQETLNVIALIQKEKHWQYFA